MAKPVSIFLLFLLLLKLTSYVSVATNQRISTFDIDKRFVMNESISLPPEFVTYNYTQTLDHFNYKPESYQTFQQRYVLNSKYWGGANTSSPIFVYTSADYDLIQLIPFQGFVLDLAARFNGLLLYIEHRYYGESVPFGSLDNQTSSTLGYFSSTQALADYAQLILDVKKNLSAENCPVIAIGGFYGGMLASWFRLKYPHIVIGALASSAPILYFDDITPQDACYVVISNDFKNVSDSCYNTIKQSWSEIDRVAAESNGLATLGNIFSFCQPPESSQELKDILEEIMYTLPAMYDYPPDYPIKKICSAIDGAPEGTYILRRVAAGFNASFSFPAPPSCYSIYVHRRPTVQQSPFAWQACTEMIMPIGRDGNNTMFQASPFDLNSFTQACIEQFGVAPRPHWITTEFGGHDIKTVLGNFGSNIIFSNGLRDPFSAGGVLEDISDSIVAIYTDEGAHCLDLRGSEPSDPTWLVSQREKEITIIASWIAQHNAKFNLT